MQSQGDNHWYKQAIIYAVDVRIYKDGNGDGIGDFRGLTEKLDYILSLGVNCLWLLPFFPSPGKDNGYDISDYCNIHPDLGTLDDFALFMKEAKKRELKVLVDFVLNHTSDRHPWFIASKHSIHSRYRDYYIWTKSLPPGADDGLTAFPGAEYSSWNYDETAQAYYYHWFYKFEPDLKIKNPDVQQEIYSILDFWLSFDIDGFRVDALSHMIEEKGLPGTKVEDPGALLEKIKERVIKRKKTAILLGEADVKTEEIKKYFGTGNRVDLLYNFLFDNFLFLSLAKQSAAPLLEIIQKTKVHFNKGHWANFIRNLDELDLEQLPGDERELVLKVFGPEKNMQIYNRGIRRRFAPMMKGNRKAIEMAYSLLFSLPGCPVIPYGDEIGMGEDLDLPQRDSVRTVMQWNAGKNAGFSPADKTTAPVIDKGDFDFRKINVALESEQEGSLLNWFRSLIAVRQRYVQLVIKDVNYIRLSQHELFVHATINEGNMLLFIHNLSDKKVVFGLPEKETGNKKMKIIFSNRRPESTTVTGKQLEVDGYGYYWIELIPQI